MKLTRVLILMKILKDIIPIVHLHLKQSDFAVLDNQGLNGIEAKYDEVFKGKKEAYGARITDAKGRNISESEDRELYWVRLREIA